eukprot:4721858-Pyramimonas_sp.AAC.1
MGICKAGIFPGCGAERQTRKDTFFSSCSFSGELQIPRAHHGRWLQVRAQEKAGGRGYRHARGVCDRM